MSEPDLAARPLIERYQPWRWVVEPGFWVLFIALQDGLNSWLAWIDANRGQAVPFWQPAVWEGSSHLMVLLLLPAILAFERRVPLRLDTVRQNLPWHLLATVVFSALHVGGMLALRQLAYLSQHQHYTFGPIERELPYEYFKDFRTYFLLLVMVACYRLLLLRLQGEARLLDAPDEGAPVEPIQRPDRFLVRKLGKEFLLPAIDIEWIQAWGNYVNLRVRGHDYPLRATMSSIEQRLDPKRFVRVHRSYILNLDAVLEIEPLESGDARAKLRDGALVPISRRYRDALRADAL